MHIKYITNVRIPTARAHGYAIMKMCSEFAKAGVETELYVPERGNNDNKKDPFDHYKIERNFEIKRIPSFDLLGRTLKFGRIFYWIDIVSFLLTSKLKMNLESKDILYTRDFLATIFLSGKALTVLELHYIPNIKFFFNLAIKKAERFVVLNSNIKNILTDLGVDEKKVLISPSGVDLSRFIGTAIKKEIKGIGGGDFVYGYIGTLKTMGMEKGVDDSLKALSLLPLNYKFLIVGGEIEDVEYYKKMAEDFGVSDRAIFIGQVSQTEVAGYIMQCNALVAPYPENEHYSYFMSPLKIFEYMASKKPIIGSNLPSIREVLTNGENAILIPPSDPQALANAIIRLKENLEYAAAIAERAFEEVQKYTWKKRVENILRFIRI